MSARIRQAHHRQRQPFLAALILFLAAMAASVFLQSGIIKRWRELPYRYRDTLYLPSSQYVKTISLGYDQFTADFLWLRMIQSFAAGWSLPENAPQIKSYFDVITDLDPRFVDVYDFAIMAIGEEGRRTAGYSKDPDATKRIDKMVLSIVDKAALKNPLDYHTPYSGAFHAFWTMNDPQLAKYFVRLAKTDPHYPDYIARWEGFFDLQQGRYQAAYEKYLADFVQQIAAGNKELYGILSGKLNEAINQWFLSEIRRRAIEWRKRRGQYPTIQELDQAGAFKGVTLPDARRINTVLDGLLQGAVAAGDEKTVTQFIRGAIRTWDRLPAGPYDFLKPSYPGFIIWKGLKPDNKWFVLSTVEMLRQLKAISDGLHGAAEAFKKKEGHYPPNLGVFAVELQKMTDPAGGQWIYDPKTGEVHSETYPNAAKLDLPEIW